MKKFNMKNLFDKIISLFKKKAIISKSKDVKENRTSVLDKSK